VSEHTEGEILERESENESEEDAFPGSAFVILDVDA
jgi:hypothetical protein